MNHSRKAHCFSCFVLAAILVAGGLFHSQNLTAQTHPLSENSWSNPEFVKRFLGSYGIHTRVEPEITREEAEFFETLVDDINESPSRAIQRLSARINPESSPALTYTLASLLLQEGRVDDAIRHYEEAIKRFPNFMRAHKNLGLAHLQKGNFGEAIPFIVRGIELGDNDGNTFGLLGYAYLNSGNPQSALDAYRLAYVLKPENRDWKIGKAQSLQQTGNHLEAAAILLELIEEQPRQRNFWMTRANVFISLGEEMEAAKHLEMMKRMEMEDATSLRLLGDIYMNQQLPEIALENYLAALERTDRPLPLAAAMQTARNLTRFGAYEQAMVLIPLIEGSYSGELSDAQTLELLNLQAEIALGRGDDATAAEMLEEVVRVDPMNGDALILLGNYHSRQGSFEEAQFFFERAQSLTEYQVEALIGHARMQVARRDYGKAVELLEQAQAIRPQRNVDNYLIAVRNAHEATR